MDESTTESPAAEGVVETQPEASAADDSAVTTDESTTTTTEDTKAEGSTEGATDENLSWLQSKGIDPTDPEAMAKVAKMYREAEKTMHESTEKASKLQNALEQPAAAPSTEDDDNPVVKLANDVQALKMAQSVTAFWSNNPDAKAYEPAMSAIINENPTIKALVKTGYVSVEQLYQMARGADKSLDDKLKTEGGREALQKVADKQQGRAVHGQATKSSFGDDTKPDLFKDALLGKINT